MSKLLSSLKFPSSVSVLTKRLAFVSSQTLGEGAALGEGVGEGVGEVLLLGASHKAKGVEEPLPML